MLFSAIITAHQRRPQLLATLNFLFQCEPPPSEVLVHVDGGDAEVIQIVKSGFPAAVVSHTPEKLGPGGCRNLLITAARNDWVASFDDDSHPIDRDFFARLETIVQTHPQAAVIACNIVEPGQQPHDERGDCKRVADYVGCGCVHRRSSFVKTTGYVPLALAYGMEEVDHSLRIIDAGEEVIYSPALRVIHNTDPGNRGAPNAVAASIANIGLRAWLRYPWWLVPLGSVQAIHRILWLLCHGFPGGILSSIPLVPKLIREHRGQRKPVSSRAFWQYYTLRKR